jgi:YidC/Oxa1 family membrane protein insertase
MRLYSEAGVNPLAGCLPLLMQMPIFFALYFAIRNASNSGEGNFSDSFLWISDLSQPDKMDMLFFSIAPLAILAGIFQFVQMRMMRPANQGKLSDPQQAMMQTMMNFMPLMVVIFGWNFAAGVVLYWAIQSLYSVVQQWFITGWGAMKDWFPWLPELPEHRRLGRRKTGEPKVVVSGQEEFKPGGLFGFMQRSAQRMEERQRERVEKVHSKQEARVEDVDDEPEHAEADVTEEGVVRISAQGGRARRRGQRRRDAVRDAQGGSD